eukprot:3934353-Rhodomonas_salina.5
MTSGSGLAEIRVACPWSVLVLAALGPAAEEPCPISTGESSGSESVKNGVEDRPSLDSLAGPSWKVGRGGVAWSAPAPFPLPRPPPSWRACNVIATPAAFAGRCVRSGGAGLNRGRIFVQVRGWSLRM